MILRVFYLFVSTLYVNIFRKALAENSSSFNPYQEQDNSTGGPFNFSQYQTFAKIENELHRIARDNRRNISKKLFSIGKTFEGRNLWALKIERNAEIRNLTKKTIVVDCGAHAREWIAPSTCMYIIHEFVSEVSPKYIPITERLDWVIIPLLNPDGYVFTWHNKSTRLWRKNRSFTKEQIRLRDERHDELCIGVDVNRNFDEAWGGVGAPVNPCFEMYAGHKAFSERESTALAKFLKKTENQTIAYVSLHAYGQSWMTPWGYTGRLPKTFQELKRVAQIAVDAMQRFSGVKYSVGPSHKQLYPNSGSSTDWAYSHLDITYSYLIEMLPDAKNVKMTSFMPPPSLMVKNSKDILEGLKTMALAFRNGNSPQIS